MSKNNSLITTRTDGPGDRLLIAIQENSMTQKKFAQLIGMSPNGLNSIIKGKKRLSRVLAIATERLTGVRADWILQNEQPKTIDALKELDPWARLILEYFQNEHEKVHDYVFREIEQKASDLKHGLEKDKIWSEEERNRFDDLLREVRGYIQFFLGSEEGWAPNMFIYLVMSFRYERSELEVSWLGMESDASKSEKMSRVWEIREEMSLLLNKNANSKG